MFKGDINQISNSNDKGEILEREEKKVRNTFSYKIKDKEKGEQLFSFIK